MGSKFPNTYRDYTFSLTIVTVSSLLVRIWGNFLSAPAIVKLIYGFSIWFMLVLFPWSWIKNNDFSKTSRFILNSMLLWGLFEICRSVVSPSPETLNFGNRFITLLFNEYCAFIFIPPLFAYTVCKYNILHDLFRYSKYYVYGGIFVFLISINLAAISFLSTYFFIFWDYVKRKKKTIILIVYIVAMTSGVLGARVFLIFSLVAFSAYLLCYRYYMKRLQKTVCIVYILFPIISFVPLLSINAQNEDSGFKKILNYVGNVVGNKDISADSRTFLYLEMALDLRNNEAMILGKGANSRYYSQYFDAESSADSSSRLISEVPILLFMLRGGIVYCILNLLFILLCIYNAVWKGRSRFMNCIGIMLAGWFANLFVGDVSGCNFHHLMVYSLCGLCLSQKWLGKTDREIKNLINTHSLIKMA